MILTQEEAKVWSEILKGFSEGKEYQVPMVFDKNMNVVQYKTITDFTVNPHCPTIHLSHNGMNKIDYRAVSEVEK